ncbi:hypothetical protein ACIRU8_11890 [Streptomyces sp. NPDC101175]|uniref:hypothetical protein n=1 Tax=Streptomyces sp. NPDC101175 TaxID=3366123 RepID=UPI0038394439
MTEGQLNSWLTELSETLRTPRRPSFDQADHLRHCLCATVATLRGETYPDYTPSPQADPLVLPPDAEKECIRRGKELEAALRGVLGESANRTSMREADNAFDSLFAVAGYVSLMHADPDTYVAEGIRRSVPPGSSPTIKVVGALLAASVSPPLIGWTNQLTKMLGQAVAQGRAKSLTKSLDRAVQRADRLLAEFDRLHGHPCRLRVPPDSVTSVRKRPPAHKTGGIGGMKSS